MYIPVCICKVEKFLHLVSISPRATKGEVNNIDNVLVMLLTLDVQQLDR